MAIRIVDQYPGKTAGVVEGYPHGKARNVSAPNDGTGTPLEAALVNDDQGFKQALLQRAGIAPSGTPDTADESQYLQAMLKIIADQIGIRPVAMARFGYVGGVMKIFASKNVSAVERLAVGKYRIRFQTALPSVDYVVTGNAEQAQTIGPNMFAGVMVPAAYAVNYVDVWVGDNSEDAFYDSINANVVVNM